jgi:hypothetical protein
MTADPGNARLDECASACRSSHHHLGDDLTVRVTFARPWRTSRAARAAEAAAGDPDRAPAAGVVDKRAELRADQCHQRRLAIGMVAAGGVELAEFQVFVDQGGQPRLGGQQSAGLQQQPGGLDRAVCVRGVSPPGLNRLSRGLSSNLHP